jgi:Ni/Co efflux regulator RcnB
VNRLNRFAALTTLSAVMFTGMAIAQDDHHDADHHDTYVKHDEWKKGAHMKDEDWQRAQPVDYRTYKLRRPPSGYEWRQVDGNFVLAKNGIVASVVIAPH